MNTIQELVEGHGGTSNISFIVPMRPIRIFGPIAFTSSSDGNTPVECHIVDTEDDLYSLKGTYKLRVEPIDPAMKEIFGYEKFYQSDFMGLIREGTIKIKILETIA
jgi:hypothetical protein